MNQISSEPLPRPRSLGAVLVRSAVFALLFAGCAREEIGSSSPELNGKTSIDDVSSTQPETPAALQSGDEPDEARAQTQVNDPVPAPEQAPITERSQLPSTDPNDLRVAAFSALQAGNVDAAFDLGRQAMRLAPDDPQVVFLMAMILGKRNRFPEAIRMLEELAEANPSLQFPAMGQTAEWLVQFGQWSEAEKRYRAILEVLPDSALVHRNLAQLMVRQGRRAEAAKHLDALLASGEITEDELRSLLLAGQPFADDASRDGFEPIGALGNARSEISQGELQSARQRLEARVTEETENDGVDTDGAHEAALLGRVYADLEDYVALEDWVANQTEMADQNADAWFARGVNSSRKGDHRQAVRCFAETVLRDQTDHQAYSRMSESLKELDASQEAAEASKRAEWIEQTQLLGAAMASSEDRDVEQMSELTDLLVRLHRPLEALAWRGVRLGYAQAASTVSDAEAEQTLSEIAAGRSSELNSNRGKATRDFILCGVDLDSLALSD